MSAADTAAEVVSGGGVDSYTPFATNVTLKVPVYDRGVEGVPTVNDNYWTKWIQKNFGDKYNITVEYVPITRTDVMTDYALLAASDSLPTILMEYDYPKVAQWANDGYLATFNMDDFAKVNAVYAKYFTKDCPTRSCVEVARLPKDVLIEIEAIAVK